MVQLLLPSWELLLTEDNYDTVVALLKEKFGSRKSIRN